MTRAPIVMLPRLFRVSVLSLFPVIVPLRAHAQAASLTRSFRPDSAKVIATKASHAA